MDYTFWDLYRLNSYTMKLNEEKELSDNLSPEDKIFAEFWYRSDEQNQVNWWSPDINQENNIVTHSRY